MTKKMLVTAGLLLCVSAFKSSCKKDNDSPSIDTTNDGSFKIFTIDDITTVQNLAADTITGFAPTGQPVGAGKYAFFSLSQKAMVPTTDSATTKWDVGFRGSTIIVNSGVSGPGNGGAFVWSGVFDALTSVPADSVFRTDDLTAYAIPTGSGKGWYTYDGMTNLLSPAPGRVLVIRTADGKYAKMEILNYYKGGQTPSSSASDEVKLKEQRYYTFRYVYQPDGTKNF